MSQSILASHFNRQEKSKEYDFVSPEQVFNLDTSVVSTRTATQGEAKEAMDSAAPRNAIDFDLSANAEHLDIVPVVFACGRV